MIDLSKLAEELVAIFDRLAAEHGHKKAEKYMASGMGAVLGHMTKTRPKSNERLSGRQLVEDLLESARERWVSYVMGPDGELYEMRVADSKAEVEGPIKDRIDK